MTVDVLNAAHVVFSQRYSDAAVAFAAGSLLQSNGGLLCEGYRSDAPTSSRTAPG